MTEPARRGALRRAADDPALVFILLALLCGIALSFATPPFQIPDEVGHFWRAAALSQGDFNPKIGPAGGESDIPPGYKALVLVFWRDPAAGQDGRITEEQWRNGRDLARDLNVVGTHVSYPAIYSPTLYVPQTIVAFAGRSSNLRPIHLFYAGRLASLLCYIALIAAAIRVTPVAKEAFALAALFPMSLTLGSSWSADAIAIPLAFLFCACVARAASGSGEIARREWRVLVIVAMLLATGKAPYVLLTIGTLLIPRERVGPRRTRRLAMFFAAVAAGFALSLAIQIHGGVNVRPDVSAAAQWNLVSGSPGRFVGAFVAELRSSALEYAAQAVGQLGLLDVFLPRWSTWLMIAALVTLAFFGGARLPRGLRVAWPVIVLVAFFVTMFALYLTWTPVGAPRIEGFQGRYLLPVLPALAAALSSRAPRRAWLLAVLACAALIGNGVAVTALVQRYY